jgi:serine/threonine protein kinase
MAYIQGRDLSQFIKSKKRQSETVVANVVRKLALALREAHSNGVLHRDLKPANVMIDRQNEPVVMDFGLARTITGGDSRMTDSGTIVGTPAYMSPEQVEGETDKLGPQSDVFSLGVLFYELLTGELPFQGKVGSVLAQIVSKDPRPPSELRADLHPELEAICLRMLSKRIEDRYKSMSGVAVAITEYLKSTGRR